MLEGLLESDCQGDMVRMEHGQVVRLDDVVSIITGEHNPKQEVLV